MSETTGYTARTVHRTLKYEPSIGRFTYDENNTLPVDFLILDEAGMLDVALTHSLLRALSDTTHLLLVGDIYQLPSVGAGNVLHDCIESPYFHVTYLNDIFRQGKRSSIVTVAHNILEGKCKLEAPICSLDHPQPLEEDLYFVPAAQPEEGLKTLERLCWDCLPKQYRLDPVRDIQILAPMHRGSVGIEQINNLFQQRAGLQRRKMQIGEQTFFVGDKVIQLKNDYNNGIFNGIQEGDLLVFNNERLARYVLGKRYARYRDKVLIAPYGHEGVKPRPPAERGDGKLRLTHVGQLYGNRTLEALLGGLTLLKERSPELYRRLAVRQVGFASERERKRAAASPAGELVEFAGQVPYGESIEEMYRADWLLVIDPVFDDPRKNIYIPGKLYDYLSTGRPILCIAAEDSATGDAAKQAGLLRCAPTAEQVYTALRTVLEGTISEIVLHGFEEMRIHTGIETLDHRMKELSFYEG